MGTGIGIVSAAVSGLKVKFVDLDEGIVKSKAFVESWCTKEVSKKRFDEKRK